MRCSETGPIVTVEKFMEPDVVFELRITIEPNRSAIGCAAPVHIFRKDVDNTMLDLFSDLV